MTEIFRSGDPLELKVSEIPAILIVEDEETVRMLVTHVLEEQGYRVLQTGNAEEAEKIWVEEKSAIDLEIADINLPGLSGPEFVLCIRKICPA